MTTFASLGIPFPLFEGPVSEASEYVGDGRCFACDENREHCFALEIGAAVIVACSECGSENGLDADDAAEGFCRSCAGTVPFPVADEPLVVCYACLRAGRAALSKDSTLGMISWEQAVEGVTHGVPGLRSNTFELVDRGEGWIGARLSPLLMWELLRTPTYITIQGDRWEFCCGAPMIFLGRWTEPEFNEAASDGNGRALFDAITQDPQDGLWEDELHDVTGIYVFRCAACERMTANWDIG